MTLIIDAGGLKTLERQSRDLMALLKSECTNGRVPMTHGGVVGQVWRGGSGKQENLARALLGIETIGLDQSLGKSAGVLLKQARASDVVDAAVVALASDGDEILTSDVESIAHLARAAGLAVDIVRI